MDMLVQLESGVLVNLEIQKVGYDFPGQRSACCSSDLVMREYSRLRSQTHGRFSYRDIGKVITIVVIENSSRAFHQADGGFVHHFKQSSDDPTDILRVTEAYPYFKELYSDMLKFQKKPEELVNMFSEALEMLDRNTVQYMIEEREQEILKNEQVIKNKDQEIEDPKKLIVQLKAENPNKL